MLRRAGFILDDISFPSYFAFTARRGGLFSFLTKPIQVRYHQKKALRRTRDAILDGMATRLATGSGTARRSTVRRSDGNSRGPSSLRPLKQNACPSRTTTSFGFQGCSRKGMRCSSTDRRATPRRECSLIPLGRRRGGVLGRSRIRFRARTWSRSRGASLSWSVKARRLRL